MRSTNPNLGGVFFEEDETTQAVDFGMIEFEPVMLFMCNTLIGPLYPVRSNIYCMLIIEKTYWKEFAPKIYSPRKKLCEFSAERKSCEVGGHYLEHKDFGEYVSK